MTKEELINFINSIDFEISTCMTLTYIKKTPTRYMDDSERYNAEPKTITFQKDYESLINEKNSWIERIEDKLKDFLKSGLKGIKDILNEILGDDKDE